MSKAVMNNKFCLALGVCLSASLLLSMGAVSQQPSYKAKASPKIVTEYADSRLEISLDEPQGLSPVASAVSPRIIVEYADSILTLDLEPPVPLVQPSTPTPTPAPTPEPPPEPEQPVLEPGQPQPPPEPIPKPTPVPSSPTPWWLEPQWLVSAIIGGLACIAGIIRLVIVLRRRS